MYVRWVLCLALMTSFVVRGVRVARGRQWRLHASAPASSPAAAVTASSPALTPTSEYEYLDSGNNRRLERFGGALVIRNCPSAVWAPGLPPSAWAEAPLQHDGTAWSGLEHMPASWRARVRRDQVFELAPSEQGQVGVFPEQMEQWRWIRESVQRGLASSSSSSPSRSFSSPSSSSGGSEDCLRVLNGFAYTGGSTMAALGALESLESLRDGATTTTTTTSSSRVGSVNVTHLDASSAAVKWAQRNVAASGLAALPCRFIVDDCATFLKREIARGKRYDGLIFDPPAFGRAAGGKTWKLDKDLPTLVDLMSQLLSDRPAFVLLSCHDPAWGGPQLQALLEAVGPRGGRLERGEMGLQSRAGGRPLGLGSYARVRWGR